jgi:hypothetical protein
MFERLRKGLGQLMRRGSEVGAAAAPSANVLIAEELSSRDAHLRITQTASAVCFQPDFADEPMLTLPGQLAGLLSTVHLQGVAAARTACRLEVPLQFEGRLYPVQITAVSYGERDPDASFSLSRASRRRIPPGEQAIEIVYGSDLDQQLRYLVQIDSHLRPVDFRDFSKHEAVFEEVPPVAQMIAFLKATLHHRRTTLKSLSSMARRADSPKVRDVIAAMQERLSQSQDFTTPAVQAAQTLLEERGLTVNRNTVTALCLLADIFLDTIRPSDLEALAEGGVALPTSATALLAVTSFLGTESAPTDWAARLPDSLPADADRAAEALAFLKQTVGQRNALSILADLADDSGSERSRQRVERLLARVSDSQQNLINDEHEALAAYLSNAGRPVQIDTITALGIYVDFEAGILSLDDIEALTPRRSFLDISLYSMLAIAGAFDVDLRAYRMPSFDRAQLWRWLERLVESSQGGAIARFIEKGEAGHLTLFLADRAAVRQCRKRGLDYHGEVMCRLPIIDYLQEHELAAFKATGNACIACFGSEEKRLQWRLLDEVVGARPGGLLDVLGGSFSFVDRYELYHFSQRVLARTVPAEAAALVGQRNLVAVYRDLRGSAQYHYLPSVASIADVITPPHQDWEWAGAIVEFPDLGDFPHHLIEPSHEYLLGQPDDRAPTQKRLDRIYGGLEARLGEPYRKVALDAHAAYAARLEESWRSPALRALLVGLCGPDERERLLAQVHSRVDMAEPLFVAIDSPQLLQFAALAVLAEIAHGGPGGAGFDADKLDELLLDQLYRAAESDDAEARDLACQIMGCAFGNPAVDHSLATSYVLSRFLESERPSISHSAARSLAALALRAWLPLPRLVTLSAHAHAGNAEAPAEGLPALDVTAALDEWAESLRGKRKSAKQTHDLALLEALRHAPHSRQQIGVLWQALEVALAGESGAVTLLSAQRDAVHGLLRQILQTWRDFAASFDMPLHRLVWEAFSSRGMLRAYESFVDERGERPTLEAPGLKVRPSKGITLPELARWFEPSHVVLRQEKDHAAWLLLDVEARAFVPLLDARGHDFELDSAEDEHDLEALAVLYDALVADDGGARGAGHPRPNETLLNELAAEVVRVFNLPPEHHRISLHMLLSLTA